ncbi:response regulator transcription factor [Priestia megaterium]|uniref:Response regulator transcription factor n=1 Tax=Priestia megaterium TaxID=1404 RepID=A0A6H1NZ81_PRIMG|nr:response regulator transcription factor [Priestia megaterium]QIZ06371.1 response regulator transcription factor [Priestia megaterium]
MIRIVIAEDQEMLLGAIGSLLNLEEDMEVVGQASNGEEALALVHRLQPDVCIMDIEMPEMSGLEAAESLKACGCKVIILTTFARSGYYGRALQAGVSGYLLKDSPSEELAGSIRSIINGQRIYCPELIDEDSNQNEQSIQEFQPLAERKTKISTVRNYLTTILDRIKLPTG